MLHLIIKMLWSRKRRYGWLLCELLIVSLIVWGLFDPLLVLSSIESMPNGFKERNLYRIVLAEYPKEAPRYQFAEDNFDRRNDNMWYLLQLVRQYNHVSHATFFGSTGPFCMSSLPLKIQKDTLQSSVWGIQIVPGSDYFQTMCFDEIGSQTNKQLDDLLQTNVYGCPDEVVVSDACFPGVSILGVHDSVNHHKVIGTTAMVRMRAGSVPMPIMTLKSRATEKHDIVFRVRDGVDEDEFLSDFSEWAKKNMQAGNYYVRSVQPFYEFMEQGATSIHQQFRVRSILGAFFLLFLFLGVTGAFWMQTRCRCEEIGIMKSFGATSSVIVRSFLIEGVLLVTLAVVIACLVYLQYALKEGLYNPFVNDGNNIMPLYSSRFWFEDFSTHFLVVSLFTWLLMLVVVCCGIFIPAYSMSKIPATEALKEE